MEKTDLTKILSVSGEHGLFAYIAQGRNGIIAESLETGNRQLFGPNAKVSALDSKIESVASAWTGISSNAFYNNYVNMQPTMHSFAQILQQIAQVAQTAAKTYDDVDVQLASNFNG